jgi:hypothetical protein
MILMLIFRHFFQQEEKKDLQDLKKPQVEEKE